MYVHLVYSLNIELGQYIRKKVIETSLHYIESGVLDRVCLLSIRINLDSCKIRWSRYIICYNQGCESLVISFL